MSKRRKQTDLGSVAEYPPDALLTLAEAAAYVRRTPQALRCCISRGQLVPDGRGHRGTHLFFARTMLAFATKTNVRNDAADLAVRAQSVRSRVAREDSRYQAMYPAGGLRALMKARRHAELPS